MTCFVQDSPMDYLLYYPIILELNHKKVEYTILNLQDKTTTDVVIFASTNVNITDIVVTGTSALKLFSLLLFTDMNIPVNTIDGHHRMLCHDQNPVKNSMLMTTAAISTSNFVTTDTARTFLMEEGIRTSIQLIECPVSHLCTKPGKRTVGSVEVVIICENDDKLKHSINQMSKTKLKFAAYHTSDIESNIKEVFENLSGASRIVSDSFMLDTPCRQMAKHFFYLGDEITSMDNLGVSTHIVSGRKKELYNFLNESMGNIPSIPKRDKSGLHSLIKNLN